MKESDKVQFNCDFENSGVLVETDDVGVVRNPLGALGYLSVEAKGMIWLCKPHEVRLEGTPTTQGQKEAMRADQELVADFTAWLDAQEGD